MVEYETEEERYDKLCRTEFFHMNREDVIFISLCDNMVASRKTKKPKFYTAASLAEWIEGIIRKWEGYKR